MHAVCLNLLASHGLSKGNKFLDIGSGSGWLVAAVSHLVGEDGLSMGIEHVGELSTWSRKNIECASSILRSRLEKHHIILKTADGRAGEPSLGPWNAIHVGAASPQLPTALIDQLAPGGILICPVGVDEQNLVVARKGLDGSVEVENEMGVRYVPLTSLKKQTGWS